MVINLVDLQAAVEVVLEQFDHKHLNLDTPYFTDRIPTSENLAAVLWDLIAQELVGATLNRLRLYETDDLYVEYFGESA
jgi:6-pyruvoyltetrahydropterin/6-carboxytetrahydropterin synthase